ncbi:MAG: ATP phosphoribosyltransferase [Brevinematia bacterium]|jgi:ATP phosphoribosyltransferase
MEANLVIAVPKGRLFEDTVELFLKAGLISQKLTENSRKLVIKEETSKIDFLLVRAKDVITYVSEGIADIGVIGYDLLVEYDPDVFILADLKFGYCKVVVAGKKETNLLSPSIRVATKFRNITESYFRSKEIDPKIVELYGSVELGPITGLSDCIVDITSTGTTLRENDLEVLDEIFESTSRLIVNKKSFYFKREKISTLTKEIKKVLRGNEN